MSTKIKKNKATHGRKVVVVRKPATAKHHVKKVARRRPSPLDGTPLGVPLNLKVKGERAMRKNVILREHPTDPYLVRVLTGGRGRPSHLNVEDIERVRVL